MSEFLSVSKKNSIAIVTLNNPPMNVLNRSISKELNNLISKLNLDDEIKCIIITGEGKRAFSAGADIKEFLNSDEDIYEEVDSQKIFNFIENISKPTIAMLNGYTLGGGLELSLVCDIRIAESHIKIGFPEINLGLIPGAGGTQRLPRIIGSSKAKELMFTGDYLTAMDAYKLGIVDKVAEKGEGMIEAKKLAQKLADKSLPALSKIKKLVNLSKELPIKQGLSLEKKFFEELFITEEAKKKVEEFIEKTNPISK